MTARWRTSSYTEGSLNNSCVEVADLGPDLIGLRDSKNPTLPHLRVSPTAFAHLIQRIKSR